MSRDHAQMGVDAERNRAREVAEVRRDAVGQHREHRHAERFGGFGRDALGQDAVDREAQIGMLLGAAERQHRAVVVPQVFLHLHPVHVRDAHVGLQCDCPVRRQGEREATLIVMALTPRAQVPLCVSLASPSPVEWPAVTPMSPVARNQLAPNGRLRAALNYSNVLLVSARTPEHTGVAPDLARELARRADAAVEFIGYANAGLAADAATDDAWDVVFIGAEPARAGAIAFTPAYLQIDATYLGGGPLVDPGDRAGGPQRRADRDRGTRGVHAVPAAHAAERDLARNGRDTGLLRSLRRVAARRAGRPEAAAPR